MQHKLFGIILLLIATFLFAVLDACSKYLTVFFAVQLIVWARYLVHLVFMLVGIAPGMGREIVVTKRPWLMIFRGLLLVCASLFVVLAFRTLPLAETTALVFSTPLLVVLLAGPLLGERVPLKSWLATIVIPAYWTGEIPTLKQALIIASLGFLGGTGHFLLIRAFRKTMASTLSPLLYVQLVWATLLGWIVFGHLADLPTTIGMLIIGGSSLSLALRWPR